MKRPDVIALVAVVDRAAHGAQLAEHRQHQILPGAFDLVVRNQPRRQQPVAYAHRLVAIVDQVLQLLAQVARAQFFASLDSLIVLHKRILRVAVVKKYVRKVNQ